MLISLEISIRNPLYVQTNGLSILGSPISFLDKEAPDLLILIFFPGLFLFFFILKPWKPPIQMHRPKAKTKAVTHASS